MRDLLITLSYFKTSIINGVEEGHRLWIYSDSSSTHFPFYSHKTGFSVKTFSGSCEWAANFSKLKEEGGHHNQDEGFKDPLDENNVFGVFVMIEDI